MGRKTIPNDRVIFPGTVFNYESQMYVLWEQAFRMLLIPYKLTNNHAKLLVNFHSLSSLMKNMNKGVIGCLQRADG